MVRRFVDNPTISTRAVQIWQILVGRAHNRQTITYLELARLMHYRGGGYWTDSWGTSTSTAKRTNCPC